jgi:hypothetical protein
MICFLIYRIMRILVFLLFHYSMIHQVSLFVYQLNMIFNRSNLNRTYFLILRQTNYFLSSFSAYLNTYQQIQISHFHCDDFHDCEFFRNIAYFCCLAQNQQFYQVFHSDMTILNLLSSQD